jgi:hypothetical protein
MSLAERKGHSKMNLVKSMHVSKLEIPSEDFTGPKAELTLEYVQRLEDDIAVKDKEIKLIKERLVKDNKRSPVIL